MPNVDGPSPHLPWKVHIENQAAPLQIRRGPLPLALARKAPDRRKMELLTLEQITDTVPATKGDTQPDLSLHEGTRISTPRLTDTSTKRKNCTKELSLNKQTARRNGASIRYKASCSKSLAEDAATQPPPPSTTTLSHLAQAGTFKKEAAHDTPLSTCLSKTRDFSRAWSGRERARTSTAPLRRGTAPAGVTAVVARAHQPRISPDSSASPGSPTPDPAARGHRRPDPAGQSAAWGREAAFRSGHERGGCNTRCD